MKKIMIIFLFSFAGFLFAQEQQNGSVLSVTGNEIIVRYDNVSEPFVTGEKYCVDIDSEIIVLEVTFPMQTCAKCRLAGKDAGKIERIRKGMSVYASDVMTGKTKTSAVGVSETFKLPGSSFEMKGARISNGGVTALIGKDDQKTVKINKDFLIAETETTFELWREVYSWASSHGYVISLKGQMGTDGNNSGNENKSGGAKQPVTSVSWGDAVVWCNALTEYYNENNGSAPDLIPVYYSDKDYTLILRKSTDDSILDSKAVPEPTPYLKAVGAGNTDTAKCLATGFRLPASIEWEYAARYRGNDSTNAGRMDGFCVTKGKSASGATAEISDKKATAAVAVYNSPATKPVKSKTANALGLYDMSGNVWEWCFDWHPERIGSDRVVRGGCFKSGADELQICTVEYFGRKPLPSYAAHFSTFGFRFVRTR